jgi:small subunit ribosomal protein S20
VRGSSRVKFAFLKLLRGFKILGKVNWFPKHHPIKSKEVYQMANIKSAKKRILVSRRNADKNKAERSEVKTAIKKVYAAIESGDKKAAQAELVAATKTIEMAGTKGVYHKNNVARKVSRISKAVNAMA